MLKRVIKTYCIKKHFKMFQETKKKKKNKKKQRNKNFYNQVAPNLLIAIKILLFETIVGMECKKML